MIDRQLIADALVIAVDRARQLGDGLHVVGYGVAVLTAPDGRILQAEPFTNLITDSGDGYYAAKAIVGVGPANPTAPTAANGMKLGTGVTAAAKSGAGATIVTYVSGSNVAFDAGFAQTEDLGAGLGDNAVYKSTWAAGVATNSALTEVAIVNDQANNTDGSTAANTYSRALFASAINKGVDDSLAVTWKHKFAGT